MAEERNDRPAPKRETVQPMGRALDWSEDDLERMAEITPAKIADARVDARRLPELDALLSAKKTRRGK